MPLLTAFSLVPPSVAFLHIVQSISASTPRPISAAPDYREWKGNEIGSFGRTVGGGLVEEV